MYHDGSVCYAGKLTIRILILSDRSQYEVDRGLAAISSGGGPTRATDRHAVLPGSMNTGVLPILEIGTLE
ncbi:hypothetical protein C490_01904 [Natronobacterium gregoryi SP2]|uniref:Uncharacterized protein n=1 Tax=Natronobacterium gregoryi (strain ATCC 43098 / DSM 3393 / CCM 3738 / CIP 104747 / IAM 13177 / JCM 8860 / NBRC 102187 / NCIMB 2189 / SP2) TaxID=797304 RepID=L9YHS8_NATGS|nr:hypothetical protein C490_01904 [Natronobacterium gregoryi SP2]